MMQNAPGIIFRGVFHVRNLKTDFKKNDIYLFTAKA